MCIYLSVRNHHLRSICRMLSVALVCSLSMANRAWAQKVDESADWKLIVPALKNLPQQAKTDPQGAIAAWQQIYASRGTMSPVTGSIVFSNIAYIYRDLKDNDKAMAAFDKGLELYGDNRGAVELLN